MTRTNQILAALLVIQLIIAGVLLVPRGQEDSAERGGDLLPDFDPSAVDRLTLTDSTGGRLAMERRGDNEWVLLDYDDFPAEVFRINEFLDKLTLLRTDRLISENAASHSRLRVAEADFESRAEIVLDGKTTRLTIGSSAGANATHVRLNDEKAVYLVSGLASYEAAPMVSTWIDTLYFSIPTDRLVALTLTNANGTFEFVRDGETWSMLGLAEGETFNQSGFTTLLSQTSSVRMTEPIGKEEKPEFGLDAPLVTLTMTVEDEAESTIHATEPAPSPEGTTEPLPEPELTQQTYTLILGAKQGDDNSAGYAMKSSESDYFVQLASYTAEFLTGRTRENFVTVAATATPE